MKTKFYKDWTREPLSSDWINFYSPTRKYKITMVKDGSGMWKTTKYSKIGLRYSPDHNLRYGGRNSVLEALKFEIDGMDKRGRR